MKALRSLLLGLAALACAAAVRAEPVTLSGVKYDDATEVRGTKLQLNGAGVRYKAVSTPPACTCRRRRARPRRCSRCRAPSA